MPAGDRQSELAQKHTLSGETGWHELPAGALGELSFGLLRGDGAGMETGDREALLVVLENDGGGIAVGDSSFELPDRDSVFTAQPSAVYAPPGSAVSVTGNLLAGVFSARADGDAPEAYAILPDEVGSVTRGSGNFRREVRDILPAGRPATRLLVGETLNPPGNWSSSPPHKHDRHAPPEEVELEEIYLFRVDPAQGFGLQLSYSNEPPAETAHTVRDLDVVTIPRGYHPVVAGPGYGLYYLWGLAGQGRELIWYPDPAHAWVDTA